MLESRSAKASTTNIWAPLDIAGDGAIKIKYYYYVIIIIIIIIIIT